MEKFKKFNELNSEVKEINNQIESVKASLEAKKIELKNLLKDILVETNPKFEECIIEWVVENPIEAISYYVAMKKGIKEIYFKNDNKHVELFENENYDENKCYTLTSKKTSDVEKIQVSEIESFYSDLACGDEVFVEVEFLDNYRLPLIKEVGKYIHDCAWTIEYKALKYEIYSRPIFNIIDNNFIIDEE